jgi:hypothetical protein
VICRTCGNGIAAVTPADGITEGLNCVEERKRPMGEAIDKYGDVLGSATGATKREVFDKLEAAHGKDAHEIRIRSLEGQATDMKGAELTTGEPLLKFFQFDHLPPALREVSRPFCELAAHVASAQLRTPERTVCLRKLLEAKDAAVRNALP